MKTSTKKASLAKNTSKGGIKIRTTVKAGGLSSANHSKSGIKIRTSVKAGGLSSANHSRALLSA
jgi:hypothetical protein